MAAGFKSATVNAASVPSTQTNFPAYVDLSRLGITTLAEAQSVRVYADSAKTTEWAREIVSATEMHVKVPSLTSTVEMYADWDGVSADYAVTDTYGRNAVWAGEVNILHYEHTSGNALDVTGNGRDFANNNTVGYATSKIAKGADFGTSNTNKFFKRTADTLGLGSNNAAVWSFTSWFKVTTLPTSGNTKNLIGIIGSGQKQFQVFIENSGGNYRIIITLWNGSTGVQYNGSTVSINSTTDFKLRINKNGTALAFYVNGAAAGTATISQADGNPGRGPKVYYCTGHEELSVQAFDGLMDETRWSSSLPSADWETTEYNNQNDEATFWGTWSDVGNGATLSQSMLLLGVGV